MPLLTLSLLSPYRKLADEFDAAIVRGDEIGEDTIRDMLPELREAAEVINAALAEIDALLLDGLRDEALGLHDSELPVVASRLNFHERPQWPDIEAWFVNAGLAEPPRIDGEALANLEATHAELNGLKAGLERLRRFSLERASTAQKLSVLRKLRAADPTKLVWSRSVAAHEEARLAELRTDIARALATPDIAALASLQAEVVSPDWETEVPRELLISTRGAAIAQTLCKSVAQADEITAGMESRYAEIVASGQGDWRALADLRTQLQQLQPVIEECLAGLRDCKHVMNVVKKLGLEATWEGVAPRLAQPLDWIAKCEALQAVHDTFTAECRRLEYLCDNLPAIGEQSKWLTDLQRSEYEIQRCCQQVPDLVFPAFVQERMRTAKQALQAKEVLRRRFVLVAAGCATLAAAVVVALICWRISANNAYAAAVTALQEAVEEARQGGHLVRPAEIDTIAERYGRRDPVGNLLKDFDRYVEAEKTRRRDFDVAITEYVSLGDKLDAAVNDRKNGGNRTWLDAWPSVFFDAKAHLQEARRLGGLPARRNGETDEGTETGDLPPFALAQFEFEEKLLAQREKQHGGYDKQFGDLAIEFFNRQREDLFARVQALEQEQAETSGDLVTAKARKLRDEIRALARTAAFMKSKDDNSKDTLDEDRRVPEHVRQLLEPSLRKLDPLLTGAE